MHWNYVTIFSEELIDDKQAFVPNGTPSLILEKTPSHKKTETVVSELTSLNMIVNLMKSW